jgi:hypothetical protein
MAIRTKLLGLAIATLFASAPALGDEKLPTWREIWRGWSWSERARFLEGYQSAWSTAIIWNRSNEERMKLVEVRGKYALPAGQFIELVDHFYLDPANAFVNFNTAIELSVARFRGENITERLGVARQVGILLKR